MICQAEREDINLSLMEEDITAPEKSINGAAASGFYSFR